MKTSFIVNDYILIWNLLFGTSVSEAIYHLKQKIWDTYKKEYNSVYNDKELIVKDYKNFIPDDDTVYNIILENRTYEKIKRQAEKYRLDIMKIWDKNKKITDELFRKIIRFKIDEFQVFIVNKELKVIEYIDDNRIIYGNEIDKKNTYYVLLQLCYENVYHHLKKYDEEEENIKNVIVELAIFNEYATRLLGKSCYGSGNRSLVMIKKNLYPYWLMYLGVPKDKFREYMERDNIRFDESKYPYEKEFKKMNLEEFIEFCIRNQRYMIRNVKDLENTIELL